MGGAATGSLVRVHRPEVQGLRALNNKKLEALKEVSFSIRAGEILGVAGVDGNGQSELVECLTGLLKATGGAAMYDGKDITKEKTRQIMADDEQMTEQDRRLVQVKLATLGYYIGRIDANFGPETRAAIRRYQFEIKAEMTGRLTAEQATRLVNSVR